MPIRRFDQSEIVLTERRRLEAPLLVTVWLAAAGFSLAEGSYFYLLASTLGVAVNLIAVRRHREVYIHRAFVNAAVLGATGILIIELFGPEELLISLGHYLILILLCKLFEQKRNRDYVQLIVLSLLLMVAGSMICDRIWYAAIVLCQIVAACHTAMVFTLKRGLEAVGMTRLSTDAAAISPSLAAWNAIRDWPGAALRRRLGVVLIAVLLTGVAMFLLMPRVTVEGMERFGGPRRTGITGFEGNISLGDVSRIYRSDEVVMTVEISAHGGEDVPVVAPTYLRGRTYDLYAASTWSASRRSFQPVLPEQLPPNTLVQNVSLEPSLLPTLFAAHPVVRCESDYGTPEYSHDMGLRLLPHPWPAQRVRYTAWSWPQPLKGEQRQFLQTHWHRDHARFVTDVEATDLVHALARDWCADLLSPREQLLPVIARLEAICAAPGGDVAGDPERAGRLAKDWLDQLIRRRDALPPDEHDEGLDGLIDRLWDVCAPPPAPDDSAGSLVRVGRNARKWLDELRRRRDELDLDIARRLTDRLRNEYEYTLSLPQRDHSRDAVEDFLFNMKKGHCEYFASALTVLCRSVGVDARLATGFYVPPPVGGSRLLTVRAHDAHAWTEVYTPSTDWVVYDATPGGRGGEERPWWAPLRDAWRAVGYFWNEKIVGYDEVARRHLGRWFSGLWRAVAGGVSHAARAVRDSFVNLLVHGIIDAGVTYLSLAVSVLGTALLGVLAVRSLRGTLRFRRDLREGKAVPSQHMRFFARLLAALKRRGLERRPEQTPREFLRGAAGELPLPGGALEDLADLYYTLRWGRLRVPQERVRAAEEQVRKLAEALKK
jgi:transglutaminase-like putative cysteine protease